MNRRVLLTLAGLFIFATLGGASPLGARLVQQQMRVSTASVLPETPIRLSVYGTSGTFSIDVYPIGLDTYADVVNGSYAGADDFGVTPVRHADGAGSKAGFWSQNVTLGGLPIGLYAVRVYAGKNSALSALDVTTFGVISTKIPSGAVHYAVDLRSFHRRADVRFSSNAKADGARTNDGKIEFGGDGGNSVVARADDGSIVLAQLQPWYENSGSPRSFAQTDRPLYRPGDTIGYRFIERTGRPGAFVVPAGSDTITITGPSGKKVDEASAIFSSYGTVSGSYTLPADAELGSYTVTDGTSAASFTVEAYEKPEYDVAVAASSGPYVIGGERASFALSSKYFFGGPAAGIHFHYRATSVYRYRFWYGHAVSFASNFLRRDPQPASPEVEGDAVADARGRAQISIPTVAGDIGCDLQVDVDARDASGKTVTAGTSIPVTSASFELALSFDTWFARAGKDVTLSVKSATVDGKIRPHVPVDLDFGRNHVDPKDSSRFERLSIGSARVVTGDDGIARYTWRPSVVGYVDVRATAPDERRRIAESRQGIFVAGEGYPSWYRFTQATIAPETTATRPGEPARFLVTSPQADVDALVDVWYGATVQTFVQHIATVADTFTVTPPPGAGRYRVTIWIPNRTGTAYAATTADISPMPHRLIVSIAPAKKRYEPGETARFAVDVRNEDGTPASAEIGVGVVDDALLELAPPQTIDPFAKFYDPEWTNASSTWSDLDGSVSLYGGDRQLRSIAEVTTRSAFRPGTTQDMYSVAGTPGAPAAPKNPSFDRLRSDFRDTAYWSPSVVTGADGHAVLTFRWPDNLTSYTATGVAVTAATDVGNGTGSTLVTKDFLVRLATPRFMRAGDDAHLIASVRGPAGARGATVRFAAPALGIGDATIATHLDANASASSTWDARASALEPATIKLAGTSGAFSDGLQRTLPVESAKALEHERWSGALPGAPSLAFSLPKNADAGDLHVSLSPSVIAQLYNDVKLLDVYPYGCVEQTMSATLPLVDVEALAARTGLEIPKGPDPKAVAAHAVKRLGELQHEDGSWGWWEHDAANPFMTAYALYGLAELRRDGHPVPDPMFSRGIASLKAQLTSHDDTLAFYGGPQPNSLWNTRAYMFYALADAAPEEVDRKALAAVDAQAGTLNPYALSVLGLAHLEIGDRAGAQPLLAELVRRAHHSGSDTYWSGGGWHYRWEDDPIETTAYALRFVHAMTPADPRVAEAISWLRSKAHGSWWYTTKDTAAAIYALAEAIDPDRSEFSPNEVVRVTLDGRVVKTQTITSAILPADDDIVIPANAVKAGGTLRFERTGTGSLYWDADWTRYVGDGGIASDIDAADAAAFDIEAQPTFSISRAYHSTGKGPWRIGDEIDVDLTVVSKSDSQFVAIEDPLPAGLEYQPRLHEEGDDWSGLQFFDDRVVFFATQISANDPLHLHYRLRASTAGTFTAAPPTAYAMYGPPVSAVGKSDRVTIAPEAPIPVALR